MTNDVKMMNNDPQWPAQELIFCCAERTKGVPENSLHRYKGV